MNKKCQKDKLIYFEFDFLRSQFETSNNSKVEMIK